MTSIVILASYCRALGREEHSCRSRGEVLCRSRHRHVVVAICIEEGENDALYRDDDLFDRRWHEGLAHHDRPDLVEPLARDLEFGLIRDPVQVRLLAAFAQPRAISLLRAVDRTVSHCPSD